MQASKFLLEGLTILQNRGYDSAGISTLTAASVSGGTILLSVGFFAHFPPLLLRSCQIFLVAERQIVTTKKASVGSTSDSIELLRANEAAHAGHHIGIAHTRWATHGGIFLFLVF